MSITGGQHVSPPSCHGVFEARHIQSFVHHRLLVSELEAIEEAWRFQVA